MTDIDIELPDDLLEYVRKGVANGRYATASDVVEQAVTLFLQRDARLDEVRRAWQKGLESGTVKLFEAHELMHGRLGGEVLETMAAAEARAPVLLYPQAAADLEVVRRWLSEAPLERTIGSRLGDLCECLVDLPGEAFLDMACPGLDDDARHTVCGEWAILYRRYEQTAAIVRILPGGQVFGMQLGWSL